LQRTALRIERNFAREISPDAERTAKVVRINDEIGVRWLYSFLSADKRKTYCLYEAPNADAIRAARPWGVDASSGLETAPGIKDHGKVRAFVQAALHAEREAA